jgi:flagellar motility protein MotE (MotC chaperone)
MSGRRKVTAEQPDASLSAHRDDMKAMNFSSIWMRARASLVIVWMGLAMAAPALATSVEQEPTSLPDVRKYCTNIATAAAEARFAWQTAKLNELETRVRAKIKDLDAKVNELRGWVEKRDALVREANQKLVGIYAKMRPETAATQISALDDDMAAAVLSQLGPRQSSAIFNEIVPDRAAKLAGLIAATGPNSEEKKP